MVLGERCRAAAIAAVDLPASTSSATSRSISVSAERPSRRSAGNEKTTSWSGPTPMRSIANPDGGVDRDRPLFVLLAILHGREKQAHQFGSGRHSELGLCARDVRGNGSAAETELV